MIGDPTLNYLTFQSKTARRECALLRRLTHAKGEHRHAFPTPTKKPAEAGFLTNNCPVLNKVYTFHPEFPESQMEQGVKRT
ncbi:hypothetical protein, partial [Pseudomonas sp. p99-361]|uniref:hypothetical protein n=1 Tax=Pseudomonas sp. p99-361 TaxID=2479852 RepID=UPI0015AA76CB